MILRAYNFKSDSVEKNLFAGNRFGSDDIAEGINISSISDRKHNGLHLKIYKST